MKTLLKGGCVLTLDRKIPNMLAGDVLIEDGRITEVAENIRSRDAEVIDCTDTIVMPGFVDTHRHTWRSLFRNAGVDAAGAPISASPYGRHHQPDDIYAATLIGLLGAAGSGTTTVVDWADFPDSPEHLDAALQAHADAGIRTVFVQPSGRSVMAEQVVSRFAAGGLSSLAVGGTEPTPTNLDQVASELAMARSLGLRLHAHSGTTASRDAVAALGARGLLGDDVTLVHCTNLGDSDLDAIASSGTAVSLTPSTEMASGLGSPPIQQLIDREIRPGLGVDDESLAPGDMFAQIRSTISIQHATLFEQKLAGKAGVPALMSTREVIRYGTVDGARTAGLAGVTGTLTPGTQADAIVLRTDRPNIFPINDPIGAVVWGVDTSNLDWVFVGGRPVMREGELDADVANARGLATAAQQRVSEAAGLLALTEAGGSE
jgi:cytosine/adenosine deaminase-related metal-dependent hydrolase